MRRCCGAGRKRRRNTCLCKVYQYVEFNHVSLQCSKLAVKADEIHDKKEEISRLRQQRLQVQPSFISLHLTAFRVTLPHFRD